MIWLLVSLVIFFVLLSGFFSGSETGAYRISPIRMRLGSQRGDPGCVRLAQLLQNRPALVTAMLIGTTATDYFATIFMSMLLAHALAALSPEALEFYTTLLLTPILFVFGEVVPKNWFNEQADRLMPRLSIPLWISVQIARWTGLTPAFRWLSSALLKRWSSSQDFEEAIHPRREIISMLQEGVAEGVLSEEQTQLVDNVLALSSTAVKEVMTPLSKVACVNENATREQVLELLGRFPHSKYPVLAAGRRQVIGMIDVYEFLADPSASTIKPFIFQPIKLSPRSSVSATLFRMRQNRQTFGMVIDLSENCLGIITLQDLVEEVFGELPVQ